MRKKLILNPCVGNIERYETEIALFLVADSVAYDYMCTDEADVFATAEYAKAKDV